MKRHNVNPYEMHQAITARLQAGLPMPFVFSPEEAHFVARMIEYVDASTRAVQDAITLIENDAVTPSDPVQRAHYVLIELRGKPTP